jgi:hypothetical protein
VIGLCEYDLELNGTDRGNPKDSEKNVSNATSSTANLTATDLGANSVLRDERLATNRLSYGTAFEKTTTFRKPDLFPLLIFWVAGPRGLVSTY